MTFGPTLDQPDVRIFQISCLVEGEAPTEEAAHTLSQSILKEIRAAVGKYGFELSGSLVSVGEPEEDG